MSQVFGLFALVCRCWKASGWRLPPPPLILSLPHRSLGCVYGIASPLHAARAPMCVCVCVGRALLLLPPPPSASYLHLLQRLANTHLSLSCFPSAYLFLPTRIFPFLLFFIADEAVSAHLLRTSPGGELGHSPVDTLEYWGRWWTGRRAPDGLGAVKPTSLTADWVSPPLSCPPLHPLSLSVSP